MVLPNLQFDAPSPPPQALKIELIQPRQPEPEPLPELEPTPKPTPVEPPPVEPKPIKKPKPEPVQQQIEPIQDIVPVETSPQSTSTSPPPDVIKVAPSADVKPIEVAPPAPAQPVEVQKPTGPSEADINAARNAYRNQVSRELRRNQRYPKIAETRGIEGDVKLDILIDNDGNVIDVKVAESSGNESLDRAAIDAVKRSNLRQFMQDILRGHIDKITVTVGFKLT